MVLRCSLLGCDYGDAEVDREREERGSEVVVTVQEYEECTRCGDRHVISENTEVTSLTTGTADDTPTPPDAEPDPAVEQPDATTPTDEDVISHADEQSQTDADGAAATPDDVEDAEFIDADEPNEGDGVVIADAEPDAGAAQTDRATDAVAHTDGEVDHGGDETDPATDDGEILEDEETEPRQRNHGEWPDSEDVGPPADAAGDTGWPEDESPIEDDPATDDGIVLEHTEPDDDSTTGSTEIVDPDAESTAETTADPGSGIERDKPAPTPGTTDPTADDGPTEFYCPRCEFAEPNDRGSLRAGDICPDCRKGYLGERPVR
ncbi:hypothetical protein D8Y22_07725 [Salinadaptatus halalkaliphilus]|uniref:Uncharacterized protein n=1 Tax=Salinadaptatus halalkaliphilus TaxID=2419781 RepID=A0A4S3TLP9_9EURY|nr:hypothetical protein [Salinadaptatus halalkaliphilus]THE65104.1 hypothetical protein D8Y22_07725 [Salinadaptatus halalkaliphilus]